MDQLMLSCRLLNKSGVEHLRNGHFTEAAWDFTEALRLAKCLLSRFDSRQGRAMDVDVDVDQLEDDQRGPAQASSTECAVVLMPFPQQHEEDEDDCIDKLSSEWEAHRFVYKTPLQLSESATIANYTSSVEISIAFMFNLALSHHLHALRYDDARNREDVLREAIQLYELAYTVQMQEEVDLSFECTMAITNNLGQIHHLLGDQEMSSQCFQHLLSTILLVQSYGEPTACQTEGFVQSVSHLILKKSVAPAA
jgi:hypothetical protein